MGFSENKPKSDWYTANRPNPCGKSAGAIYIDDSNDLTDYTNLKVEAKFVADPHDHGDEHESH